MGLASENKNKQVARESVLAIRGQKGGTLMSWLVCMGSLPAICSTKWSSGTNRQCSQKYQVCYSETSAAAWQVLPSGSWRPEPVQRWENGCMNIVNLCWEKDLFQEEWCIAALSYISSDPCCFSLLCSVEMVYHMGVRRVLLSITSKAPFTVALCLTRKQVSEQSE